MPTISMFYGVIIKMYYFDTQQHKTPHIHVEYQGKTAVVEIPSGRFLEAPLRWIAMNPKVTNVEPLANYKLKLEFANGDTRIFDVVPFLDKGIFSQLKDEQYFKKVRVAFGAVTWPNEQDFSKDTLYLLGQPV